MKNGDEMGRGTCKEVMLRGVGRRWKAVGLGKVETGNHMTCACYV